MKKHNNKSNGTPFGDQRLAQLLKQGSEQAPSNEWFTPRVLHRLPPKQRGRNMAWAGWLCTILAAVACVVAWVVFAAGADFTVITVRQIATVAVLAATTMAMLAAAIAPLMRE